MCNSKTDRLKEELSDFGIEAMWPTFYEREHDGEMSDAGGFIIETSVIDTEGRSKKKCKKIIEQVCYDLFYRESCGCSHDCCGCAFTSSWRVIVTKGINVFGDPHLEGKPAFEVVVRFGYGLNY